MGSVWASDGLYCSELISEGCAEAVLMGSVTWGHWECAQRQCGGDLSNQVTWAWPKPFSGSADMFWLSPERNHCTLEIVPKAWPHRCFDPTWILIQPASAGEIVSRVVLVWIFGHPKWLWFYDQELEPYFNNCLGQLMSQQYTLFYIILYGNCWLFWYILIASSNSLRKIEDGKKNKRSRSRSRQRSPPPKRDRPGADGRCW